MMKADLTISPHVKMQVKTTLANTREKKMEVSTESVAHSQTTEAKCFNVSILPTNKMHLYPRRNKPNFAGSQTSTKKKSLTWKLQFKLFLHVHYIMFRSVTLGSGFSGSGDE